MNRIALISLYQIESFGTRSIYSYLKSKDVDAELIFIKEWMTLNLDKITYKEINLLIAHLKKINPRIVGITVRSIFVQESILLTNAIKKALPEVIVIWGGVHPTIVPNECINHCDGLIIGEGEKPLLELSQNLGTPEYYKVKNTWLREGSEIIKNPMRKLNDLNELPFQDLENSNKVFIDKDKITYGDPVIPRMTGGNYNFMASRGCPFNCTYCNNRTLVLQQCSSAGEFLRYRDVELVIEELKQIKNKFNIKNFSSNDEVFVLNKEWFKKFSELYIKEIGVPFHCQVHPSQITEENLKIFKKLSLKSISIGVQSGNEHTRLKEYKRHTPDAMLVEKAILLKKYKILTFYDFIVGNPLEGNEEVKDILRLLLKFPRPFGLNLYKMRHLPETELTKKLLDKKMITKKQVDGVHTKKNKRSYLIFNKLDMKNRKFIYYTNLIFLLGTVLVIKTRKNIYAVSPVPKFIIRFMMNKDYYWLNNMTSMIKYHTLFYSVLGQKISKLLSIFD